MTRFILLMTSLFLCGQTFAQCRLSVKVSSYPPFSVEDEKGGYSGLDIELSNALFKEAGCAVSYVTMPWKRGLQSMKIGSLDFMSGISISDERKKYINFVGPMRNEEVALLVPSSSDYALRSLNNIQQLDKPIGIGIGVFYGADFAEKYTENSTFKGHFYESSTTRENIEHLKNQRLSAVMGDVFNLIYLMKIQDQEENFKIHPFIINTDAVYFGFSKRNVSAVDMQKLIAANAKLTSQGVYRKIIARYK